eukprot:scaffold286_cov169-Amphora_coffeaeformis.AAC.30
MSNPAQNYSAQQPVQIRRLRLSRCCYLRKEGFFFPLGFGNAFAITLGLIRGFWFPGRGPALYDFQTAVARRSSVQKAVQHAGIGVVNGAVHPRCSVYAATSDGDVTTTWNPWWIAHDQIDSFFGNRAKQRTPTTRAAARVDELHPIQQTQALKVIARTVDREGIAIGTYGPSVLEVSQYNGSQDARASTKVHKGRAARSRTRLSRNEFIQGQKRHVLLRAGGRINAKVRMDKAIELRHGNAPDLPLVAPNASQYFAQWNQVMHAVGSFAIARWEALSRGGVTGTASPQMGGNHHRRPHRIMAT